MSASTCPQSERDRPPRRVVLTTPTTGTLWFVGWLFTIGLAHLGFWKGVLALIIWPYFLGVLVR